MPTLQHNRFLFCLLIAVVVLPLSILATEPLSPDIPAQPWMSGTESNDFAGLQSQESSPQEAPEVSPEDLRRKKADYHRKKYLWFGGAVVSGAAGLYFRYSADRHYEEYKTATHDATELHQLIELEDTLYPIAFGIGVACFLPAVSYHVQEVQVTNQLQASANSHGTINVSLGMDLTW